MSGDTQASGEKIWAVREVSGKSGWRYCVHGHVRFFYAITRKDAKEQFIKGGYKQVASTRVTAVSEGEEMGILCLTISCFTRLGVHVLLVTLLLVAWLRVALPR